MNQSFPKPWLFSSMPKPKHAWRTWLFPVGVILGSIVLIGLVKSSWFCKLLTNVMTFAWLQQVALLRHSAISTQDEVSVLGTRMLLVAATLIPLAILAVPLQFYAYQQPAALLFYLLTFASNAGAFILVQLFLPRGPAFCKQGLIQLIDLSLCPLLFHYLAHVPFTYLHASEHLVLRLIMTGLFMLLQAPSLPAKFNWKDQAQKCSS